MSDETHFGNPDDTATHAAPKERFEQAAASKQATEEEHEDELWQGTYSHLAMVGVWITGAFGSLGAIAISFIAGFGSSLLWILLGILLVWVVLVGVYLYRRWSVHYTLTNQRLIHEKGLLWRTSDRVELIDVDDVTFTQGPVERLFGVGKILISSSDRTTPELYLPGIEQVREVADQIDDARRKERRSRGLHIEAV